jgi:hypothetical protein
MECEYCKKSFSNKFTLKNHQLNAKYCLEIRKKDNENFKCSFCKKNLASKWSLDNHLDNCVDKFKILLEEKEKDILHCKENISKLENQNKELLQQIKDLASIAIDKPNTINNNHNLTNNSNNKMIDNRTLNMIPLDLNQENLKRTLEEKFTENHLINGQKGVAQFFVDNILVSDDNKYMIKCTDPSRKMFIYLDSEGKLHKDMNAFKLTHIISDPVIDISHKLVNELPDKYPDDMDRVDYAMNKFVEIVNIKTDNNEFIKNLIPSLAVKN